MIDDASLRRTQALNRHCHCISVDESLLAAELERSYPGLYATLRESRPYLFASTPVFLSESCELAIEEFIAAVYRVVRNPAYQAWVIARGPEGDADNVVGRDHGPIGVFCGFDFHIAESGPKLIEINTNAGGAFLNVALSLATKRSCCAESLQILRHRSDVQEVVDEFRAMFMAEWRAQRQDATLRTIAIVDDAPTEQFLYPEFLLAADVLRDMGVHVHICDPRQLVLRDDGLYFASSDAGSERIDLIYNRLTDFYLAEHDALRRAYREGLVVVTPHPRAYALWADKRNLVVLSDPEALKRLSVDPKDIETLRGIVPRTVLVRPDDAATLWRDRRSYFFKPVSGYGSKAAYRGDKLTKKTWSEILAAEYVAQQLVVPSTRTLEIARDHVDLKLDLRAYVYGDRILLFAARLYQGQTTNFRTPGGGFAAVFTTPGAR